MPTLFRKGNFLGPNFVDGLANQKNDIQVVSETEATISSFDGGFDSSISYTVTFHGTGFGTTSDGRYTGTVHCMIAEGSDGTSWHVFGYNASLNSTNTGATQQDFIQNLLVPIRWTYVGNSFDDVFIGGSFGDLLIGFDGDDTFQGLGGDDMIFGGAGNDTLNGEDDNDTIFGGRDDDTIRGGPGSDRLFGGLGSDDIFGDEGADQISGGLGNDTIEGGGQGDTILGELGDDEIFGQDGGDRLDGGLGHDRVEGGDGTDVVAGGMGNDVVEGGDANDFIIGGAGNDLLAGNTTFAVNPDNAIDTFLFEGDFGHDIITDFEINWDSIYLTGISPLLVRVDTVGNDVLITVRQPLSPSDSTILVRGVAQDFDRDVDIVFADSRVNTTVELDSFELPDGHAVFAIDTANADVAGRFYLAALGRAADDAGLRFWVDVLDDLDQKGWSDTQKHQFLADEFCRSDEFLSLYGSNPSNGDYIESVYVNAFGWQPDPGGFDFWVGKMDEGLSRKDVLIDFALHENSFHHQMVELDDGIW